VSSNWEELFERAISGEALDDAEAAKLKEALSAPEHRQEAIAWLQFDTALFQCLQPAGGSVRARSRERLLARAVLREKHRLVTGTAPACSRRTMRWAPLAAIVALLLVAASVWFWPADGYGELHASGDFRVLGTPWEPVTAAAIGRGDRLVAGAGGARLVLGGYWDLELDAHSDVTLHGVPGREQIELHRGALRARIKPGRGEFRVLTPLGPLEVQGTEFVTSVDFPHAFPNEDAMAAQSQQVLVTVTVLTGTVIAYLGNGPQVLQGGAQRTFAAERQDARGVVTATTDLSLTLKTASGDELTFRAPETNKLTILELSQLRPGEEVGVVWIEEEGQRWIRDIKGKGIVEGVVTGLGDRWIQVAQEGRPAVRFIPPWLGGNPDQGGGLDKNVLQKLGTVRVGDRVALTWEMPEGKRVVDVKVLQRAAGGRTESDAARGRIPEGLQGFRGILFGELTEKNEEQGTLVLRVQRVGRVWEQNRAENAKAAIGKSLPVELHRESRLLAHHRETLQDLKIGDLVEVEVFHLEDGLLRVMEVLRKVD
jgi:hypothetical protein